MPILRKDENLSFCLGRFQSSPEYLVWRMTRRGENWKQEYIKLPEPVVEVGMRIVAGFTAEFELRDFSVPCERQDRVRMSPGEYTFRRLSVGELNPDGLVVVAGRTIGLDAPSFQALLIEHRIVPK